MKQLSQHYPDTENPRHVEQKDTMEETNPSLDSSNEAAVVNVNVHLTNKQLIESRINKGLQTITSMTDVGLILDSVENSIDSLQHCDKATRTQLSNKLLFLQDIMQAVPDKSMDTMNNARMRMQTLQDTLTQDSLTDTYIALFTEYEGLDSTYAVDERMQGNEVCTVHVSVNEGVLSISKFAGQDNKLSNFTAIHDSGVVGLGGKNLSQNEDLFRSIHDRLIDAKRAQVSKDKQETAKLIDTVYNEDPTNDDDAEKFLEQSFDGLA